jgi:hypothetical protein
VARTSGVGTQVFGGAEFSFASRALNCDQREVAYYVCHTPVNLISTSGTDFYLMFHYYMK